MSMKNKRITRTLLITFFIIILLSQNVFALGQIFSTGESWVTTGRQHTGTTMDTSKINDASKQLYNILLAVAIGAAVIVGAILAIQYMTAGISKKVEVKESLFPYLVSCIVVFGSMGIWKLVVNIMKDF